MRATPRRSFRAAVTIVALTTAALLGTAGAALACDSGDGRASGHEGNAKSCADLGKAGIKDVTGDLTVTGGTQQDQYLTVDKVAEGTTVIAIVVKGGDNFNVYLPSTLGSLPWEKLHAPKNGGGQIPDISHWFACGKQTTSTETSKPTTTSKPTETSKPAPSTSETSTSSAVAPAGNNTGGTGGGGLANTGFNNMWLVWVAALLLLSGGGILGFLKFRRKASN
jgi:LPXTG-motif cell wall-anchored protein